MKTITNNLGLKVYYNLFYNKSNDTKNLVFFIYNNCLFNPHKIKFYVLTLLKKCQVVIGIQYKL